MAKFSLSNAIAGVGGALSEVGGTLAKTAIEREAQIDIIKLRDDLEGKREAARQAWQSGENALTRGVTVSEGEATRELSRTQHQETGARIEREGAATRGLQERLAQLSNDRIIEEGRLNREQQAQHHKERLAATAASMKNMGLSMQETGQGFAIFDAKTGTGTLIRDADGKPFTGKGGEGNSIKLLEAIGHTAKALEGTNPQMAQRLGNMALRLLEGKTGTAAPPAPGQRPPLESFDIPGGAPARAPTRPGQQPRAQSAPQAAPAPAQTYPEMLDLLNPRRRGVIEQQEVNPMLYP